MPEENEYKINQKEVRALVVHCGDPRFQQPFQDFIQKQLGFQPGTYVPLVIPGGLSSMAAPETYPKQFKVLKDNITFYLDHFGSIKTIVLINHEDCKGYAVLKDKIGASLLGYAKDIISKQKIDLTTMVKLILEMPSAKANFRVYFAKFADDKHEKVIFEELLQK